MSAKLQMKDLFPREQVTSAEIAVVLKSIFPMGDPTSFSSRVFDTLPQKGGFIRRDDLFKFMFKCSESLEFFGRWLFDFYDQNRDGLVTREDWALFSQFSEELLGLGLGEEPSPPEALPTDLFRAKADGAVDCKAFLQACRDNPRFLRAWHALRIFMR